MIPGFPRYFMEGSGVDGVHDLRIENAQLEDDGEFQCQVNSFFDLNINFILVYKV